MTYKDASSPPPQQPPEVDPLPTTPGSNPPGRGDVDQRVHGTRASSSPRSSQRSLSALSSGSLRTFTLQTICRQQQPDKATIRRP